MGRYVSLSWLYIGPQSVIQTMIIKRSHMLERRARRVVNTLMDFTDRALLIHLPWFPGLSLI
jgi:hypothetical protein